MVPRYSAKLLGRPHAIHLQRLGGRAEQRQRRLQLMRHVRDEVGLHARELGRAAVRLHRKAEGDEHQQDR